MVIALSYLLLSAALPCHRAPAEPSEADWAKAQPALLERNSVGEPLPAPLTEVRTLWTPTHLLIRFVCPYRELNLKTKPNPAEETYGLWNYDVAEVFVGNDFQHIGRYKEFEVSPENDWVDLDINREDSAHEGGWKWNSGFGHSATLDRAAGVWRCEMRIPFASLGVDQPAPGTRLRINFYRIEGKGPSRTLMTWQPTGARNFHVPSAFGELVLSR